MNNTYFKTAAAIAALTFSGSISLQAIAHGDVTPQNVDVSELPALGEEWRDQNPYAEGQEGHEAAITIGTSAYTQNCARCHGLDAISGGIAPDLRYLEPGIEGDDWYKYRVINGAVRDGRVYMPKMSEHLSQEALWAIRTYLVTKYVEE